MQKMCDIPVLLGIIGKWNSYSNFIHTSHVTTNSPLLRYWHLCQPKNCLHLSVTTYLEINVLITQRNKPLVSDPGRSLCSFFQASGRESLKPFSHEIELQVNKIVLVGNMVLKRPFVSDTGEVSSLHIHCSGLRAAELQVNTIVLDVCRQCAKSTYTISSHVETMSKCV